MDKIFYYLITLLIPLGIMIYYLRAHSLYLIAVALMFGLAIALVF